MHRYYQATQFFSNTSVTSLNLVNEIQYLNSQCKDTTLTGSFSENHDQPRFASFTSDITVRQVPVDMSNAFS
jgi:alpha-amylase